MKQSLSKSAVRQVHQDPEVRKEYQADAANLDTQDLRVLQVLQV